MTASPGSELAVYFTLKAQHSGKCLDVAGGNTGSGATVQQWACLGVASQQWSVVDVGTGFSELRARHGDRCLTVAEGNAGAGAAIGQSMCSGAAHQYWKLESVSSGVYKLRARHSSRCVNVSFEAVGPATYFQTVGTAGGNCVVNQRAFFQNGLPGEYQLFATYQVPGRTVTDESVVDVTVT